jgi:Domain of unknown function (DUF4082)/Bacterial Ig-like domain
VKRILILAVGLSMIVTGASSSAAPSATPKGVTGIALDGRVGLAWQAVGGAGSYNVYRGTSPSAITSNLTPSGVTAKSFTDTTVTNGTTYYYAVRSVSSGVESGNSAAVQATPAARSCTTGNAVVTENCFPGTIGWKLHNTPPVSNGGIEGFASLTSVNKGSSLNLKVNTAAGAPVNAFIYRSGYYGGAGARLISVMTGIAGSAQPPCSSAASTTGLYDCSQWSTSLTITTTTAWPSGVYIARLQRMDNGAENDVLFVVRDDSRASQLLYGVPFSTYEAYNNYGGKSLYDFNSSGVPTVTGTARAVKVSFDRPFAQPTNISSFNDWYTLADYPLVYFLEQQGYDVAYTSNVDLATAPGRVLNHKAYVSGPHDEYYSTEMRSALQRGRDAGVDLFFSGANEIYWKTRFEANVSGGSTRTLVCYKTTQGGPPDPTGDPTTTWRDPAGANNPENALTGEGYLGDNSLAFFPFVVSASQGADRVYRYTGLDHQAPGTSTTIGTSLVGWEWDGRLANGVEPPGVTTLSGSRASGNISQGYGASYTTGTVTSNMVKYNADSGALVVTTGTNNWARGLAYNELGIGEPDGRIQQVTVNVLWDMGAQPGNLSSSLTLDGGRTLLTPSDLPFATPAGTYELGVKVRVDVPLQLSALRYYRGAQETGNHVGKVWTAGGQLLEQVGFDHESASGWQQQALPTPLELQPNTVYVVSVNANTSFAQTVGGLQAGISSGPIHTVADGGNGVFSTTIGAFPNQTYNSSNYFIDMQVREGATTALAAASESPAPASVGSAATTPVRVAFSKPIDPATLTSSSFTLTAADGSSVPASLSLDSGAQVATLTPDAALGFGTTYSARLERTIATSGGSSLGAPFTWSFTTAACPCRLFSDLAQPATQPAGTYELGVKIRVDTPMQLTAIRYYKAVGETGSHTGTVWTASGFVLAQVGFGDESASGWQQQALPTPLQLQPNTTYVISVNSNSRYSATLSGLASQVSTGPLHTVADGLNGVYSTTIGSFPDQSYQSSNYLIDAEVRDIVTAPLAVTGESPAAGASGLGSVSQVQAAFSKPVDPSSLTASTFTLTKPDGTAVPAGVSLDSTAQVATLTPNDPLAFGTTYTARLAASVTAADGSSLGTLFSWSFTTAACPCQLFSPVTQPANRWATGTYELGVKFQVDQPERLTKIRYYRSDAETGTHTATLWTRDGFAIATVPFANETASGWQEQALPAPVLLQPGVTYVASVNVNDHYVVTNSGLASQVATGPLHTVADGVNGVYSTTLGAFPDQSYLSSNYFVDVVVAP